MQDLELLQKAVAQEPSNGNLKLQLGTMLLNNGRVREAYHVLIEAYQLEQERRDLRALLLDLQKQLFTLPLAPPFDQHLVQIFHCMRIPFLTMAQYANELGLQIVHFLPGEYECMYQFPTDDQHIELANQQFGLLIKKAGLSEELEGVFCASFREAIINGAHHGNQWNPAKQLSFSYLFNPRKVAVTVKDQGQGFDWAAYLDAAGKIRDDRPQRLIGGMGILMMSRCLDEVSYNPAGTAVTLAKFFDPPMSLPGHQVDCY